MPDTVYIAGPMRGIEDFNFPAFDRAAERFREAGYSVINPADLDRSGDAPKVTTDAEATAHARVYALRDTQAIIQHCTHIAMLPGWENSKGARAEKALAEWCGCVVLDAETMRPLAEQVRPRLTSDKTDRKNMPIARGLLDYFPDACAYVAHVSYVGNEQHNPGEPMHWARDKSTDHADCIVRHLIDRGHADSDGILHAGKVAWRALALLQLELEAQRK